MSIRVLREAELGEVAGGLLLCDHDRNGGYSTGAWARGGGFNASETVKVPGRKYDAAINWCFHPPAESAGAQALFDWALECARLNPGTNAYEWVKVVRRSRGQRP